MDRPGTSKTSRQISTHRPQVALLWRGNIHAPHQPTSHGERLKPLIAALDEAGLSVAPLVHFDEDPTIRESLLAMDGVLVWINPLQDGQDRSGVDALLREVASAGVWVSAHPDTILKMGTKDVLYRTQQLGWGSDTDLYDSHDAFALRFPVKLAIAGARVLKPMRGNDGQGVLKVEVDTQKPGRVFVQSASDDRVERLPLAAFLDRMRGALAGGARIIDQAFQPNVGLGMVRCYMSQDRVVGFSEQTPRIQKPDPDAPQFGMASAKTMHGADAPKFQSLRALMENEWTPGLQRIAGIETAALPAIWDADFLYRATSDDPPFVLCEINVSSVLPFPDAAAPEIAATARRAIEASRTARSCAPRQ
jgi:hypothetical protein